MFGLSGFFNPNLCQYWIKSALFTSRNLDFLHFHAVVFLSALTDLWEIFGSFQMQHKRSHNHQCA